MNYLNEHDLVAAAWLRDLRDAGLIPPCDIDTRSIEDVEPRELAGYTQCHFFAGIGGWPLALQLAGWPADRRIWTGSCPCQPFSSAGKGNGFDDERHLWPAFHWLIEQCRPPIVVGEQVASAAVGPWIDLVLTDLEALGYASGAYAGPAAGVGAPHIRDRSYWVGLAAGERRQRFGAEPEHRAAGQAGQGDAGRLADTNCSPGRQGCADLRGRIYRGDAQSRTGPGGGGMPVRLADSRCDRSGSQVETARDGKSSSDRSADQHGGRGVPPLRLADADGRHASAEREQRSGQQRQQQEDGRGLHDGATGPVNGHWRTADWLGCRDGKWRPVEPGTFPLAHGVPARVGRLRGYGNAIVPQQAAQFIQTLMEYQVCQSSPN